MRVLVDACIAKKIAIALHALVESKGCSIVHHSFLFAPQTPDPVWIRRLGEEGNWVILSGDPRITRGVAERAAWRESGLTGFFFDDGWANKKLMKQAADVIGWWPEVEHAARTSPTGSGWIIPVKGKALRQIYSPVSAA